MVGTRSVTGSRRRGTESAPLEGTETKDWARKERKYKMRKAMIALFIVSLASGLSAQTSGGMQTATVTLSAAQLQTLRESPVILIPAPGAGEMCNGASAPPPFKAGYERQ